MSAVIIGRGGLLGKLLLAGVVAGTIQGTASLMGQPVSVMLADGVSVAGKWVRGITIGYDEASCKRDPVGCLQFQQDRLIGVSQRIDSALGQLQPAAESIRETIRGEEARTGSATLYLEEGRRLLQAATDPNAPLTFIGQRYPDSAALSRQLRVIWSERDRATRFLTGAHGQLGALRARQEDLLVSRGEVRVQLAMIPAQIELARAAGVVGDVDSTLRGIDTAVSGSERRVQGADALMRTIDELSVAQSHPPGTGPAAPPSDPAFDMFMQKKN